MDIKQVAKDTAKVLTSYFTYQALRTVLAQLSENDPPSGTVATFFFSRHSFKMEKLSFWRYFRKKQELAFRLMTVRQHLGGGSSRLLAGNGSR
jgi:hypothetical protein